MESTLRSEDHSDLSYSYVKLPAPDAKVGREEQSLPIFDLQ